MSRNNKGTTRVPSDATVCTPLRPSVSRPVCVGVSESGYGSGIGSDAMIVDGGRRGRLWKCTYGGDREIEEGNETAEKRVKTIGQWIRPHGASETRNGGGDGSSERIKGR